MKKNLILILAIITLSSCSKDDNPSTKQIVGEWKLMEARILNFSTNPTIDYSNENIIYNFQSNGKLLVTGSQNIGYPNGEYEYLFGNDYLSGAPSSGESKILLVKINNSKWTYNLTNGKMILGQSYVDGPDLYFERK
jgi:hypothetical protein